MNPELKDFLCLMLGSALTGGAIGLAILWLRPGWAKDWAKFCLNRQWKLFAFGLLLFGAGAAWSFSQGQGYYGGFFLAMCALELAALMKCGFKPLTPEMARRIDEAETRPFGRR